MRREVEVRVMVDVQIASWLLAFSLSCISSNPLILSLNNPWIRCRGCSRAEEAVERCLMYKAEPPPRPTSRIRIVIEIYTVSMDGKLLWRTVSTQDGQVGLSHSQLREERNVARSFCRTGDGLSNTSRIHLSTTGTRCRGRV
ncbi:hypothetical protein B0T17DRAFT_259612 [Bombardia bombarda]|uniref:Uncharacterized protein n=1 Tax=Bombardia bombarda TaxID=252184 RepID=A0AA40C4R7_9PEZI|nr:hypothetical protein B0T17DRAFT_259612 [Bombardia bombarda]